MENNTESIKFKEKRKMNPYELKHKSMAVGLTLISLVPLILDKDITAFICMLTIEIGMFTAKERK